MISQDYRTRREGNLKNKLKILKRIIVNNPKIVKICNEDLGFLDLFADEIFRMPDPENYIKEFIEGYESLTSK